MLRKRKQQPERRESILVVRMIRELCQPRQHKRGSIQREDRRPTVYSVDEIKQCCVVIRRDESLDSTANVAALPET